MNPRPYMAEPWFALLQSAHEREAPGVVARRLGVSGSLVSQIRNGSGFYGQAEAPAPLAFAARVMGIYGSWRCPYLSEQYEEDRALTADQCRAYAHRPPATSPMAIEHWRACHQCPQKALTAPREAKKPKEVKS